MQFDLKKNFFSLSKGIQALFSLSRFFILSLLLLIYSGSLTATQAALVVKNAYIFTLASQQEKKPFNGYLVIANDGTILKVGRGNPSKNIHAKKIIDAKKYWIMPGFISAHSHLWQAAYRGLAPNKTLSGWIDEVYWKKASQAKPDDFYWFCLLGALNHLEHGITSVYNFNYGGTLQHLNTNSFDKAQFAAEKISGIRFIHGYQPEKIESSQISFDMASKRLKDFLTWISNQPNSSHFLNVMINGMTAFNNTYQQALLEHALMQQFHIGNQTHYLEEPKTQEEERLKFQWLADSALLSPQLIFGHFIHTNDLILQKSANAHVAMSWNPLSNGRLASGVADIPKYLKLGIIVGMGVDGEASADIADPFENMRIGLYTIRDKYQRADVMSPYQILWLHTMGSATALGISDKVGSLEPKKFADFIIINPRRLGLIIDNPYTNLVFSVTEKDIDQVYVGGKLVVNKDHFLNHDIEKIQAEVNRRIKMRVA
ncbi:amidohydrolase family protein [Legionella sp. CNM-1927-20]|uniref:amidohydrolase family protein n=1 Tax=Legionella sp. CNM-1927-20 TaxID=3422221 RepID=UPI00403AA765